MASHDGYQVTTYLLDRANIEDTVRKLCHYYDTHDEAGLTNDVYAPEVEIDYTSILGGQVARHKGPDWAATVIALCKAMSSHQHTNSSIISALPQPGPGASRPSSVRVDASVTGTNVRADARGGPLMQNGGRAEFQVVRLPDLEAAGVNPWRISLHRVVIAWEKGNAAVFAAPTPKP